jgi:hypothetical protein
LAKYGGGALHSGKTARSMPKMTSTARQRGIWGRRQLKKAYYDFEAAMKRDATLEPGSQTAYLNGAERFLRYLEGEWGDVSRRTK